MNEQIQKTILVVEDEQPLAEAIKKKLQLNSFSVVVARTVEQALQYLEEMKIDVVWLDHYLLGKENGLDLVARMKAEDSKWRAIPVFVVSNTASPEKVQSYIRLGISKYYAKADYRLDKIIEDIKEFLDKKDE